ncbi:MAG: hypothetical protein ACRC4J_03585 [Cetobacterium sp.]
MSLQNATNGKVIVSATDRLIGRSSAGAGLSEEIVCTSVARTLLAGATLADIRTALGLGTAATASTGTSSGNVPVLDANGQLAAAVIPAIAISSIQVVADQAARLALTNVEVGDIAKQTDNGLSYILSALPAATNANWISIGDTSIDAGEIISGTLAIARGGTGLNAIGSAGQHLRVNAGGTALEYASVGVALNRLPYTEVTTATAALVADNAYGANNASQVVLTLPATAAIGSVIEIAGVGTGGWRIAQNASQQIHFGNLSTTVGTGGRIDSTHRRDTIEIRNVVTNNEWVVMSSIGNMDVV